jgi:hypothetical protein
MSSKCMHTQQYFVNDSLCCMSTYQSNTYTHKHILQGTLKLKLNLDLLYTDDPPVSLSPPRSPPFSPTDNHFDKQQSQSKYPMGNWTFGERN